MSAKQYLISFSMNNAEYSKEIKKELNSLGFDSTVLNVNTDDDYDLPNNTFYSYTKNSKPSVVAKKIIKEVRKIGRKFKIKLEVTKICVCPIEMQNCFFASKTD